MSEFRLKLPSAKTVRGSTAIKKIPKTFIQRVKISQVLNIRKRNICTALGEKGYPPWILPQITIGNFVHKLGFGGIYILKNEPTLFTQMIRPLLKLH